jgi:hypothetical protein
MHTFQLFVEGPADSKFLRDYIQAISQHTIVETDVVKLGSWNGYKKEEPRLRQNWDMGIQNVLVLDADNDFTVRRTEVLTDFERFGIPVNLFLFPNNSSEGQLETLLCKIAVEEKILNCFDSYVSCIEGYESPVTKSKVFAYLDALLPAKHKKGDTNDLIQDRNRNYRNPDHWDLAHKDLKPLKTFLSPFFEN